MLNPLFKVDEASLNAQYEEIRFGIYEIDAFKQRYLNIMGLLKCAQHLPSPATNREEIAQRGIEKAANVFRSRNQHLSRVEGLKTEQGTLISSEETPLLETARKKQATTEQAERVRHIERKHGLGDEESYLEGSSKSAYSATSDSASQKEIIGKAVSRLEKPFDEYFRSEIHRIQGLVSETTKRSRDMLDMAEQELQKQDQSQGQMKINSYRIELKDIYQKLHQASQYVSANHTMGTRLLHSPVVVNSKFGPKLRNDLQEELKSVFEHDEIELSELISRVESLFSKYFGVGDANAARFELLAYITTKKTELGSSLASLLGFVAASVLFTLAFVFLSPLGLHALEQEGLDRIYRGLSLLTMIPWMNLIVVAALRRNRINYVLLFEMDYQTRQYHDVINTAYRASIGTLVLIANLIACLASLYMKQRFLACAFPALMLPIYFAAFYATPTIQNLVNQNGVDILKSLVGLGIPSFAIVFRADCLTSLAKPMGDIARLCCHVLFFTEWGHVPPAERTCATSSTLNTIIIPILAAWPLWVRLMHNLRQTYVTRSTWPSFANAIKYAWAHQVVIISTLRPRFLTTSPVFFIIFLVNSLIAFGWDVYMDWGLGRARYCGLRDRLMFPTRLLYYGAIAMDLVLRFTWTLTLVSSGFLTAVPGVNPILVPLGPNVPANFLELCRRCFWSILRIENEHLNNTLHYRAVDFVPLYFHEEEDDQATAPNEEERSKQYGQQFRAALQVISLLLAVIAFAVWTLRLEEPDE